MSWLISKSNCHHGFGLGFFLFVGSLTVNIFAAQDFQPANDLPTVAAIRQLTPDQAALHRPVHLRGTLTFFDDKLYACFFQDETAGIYLVYNEVTNPPPLLTGQRVEIEGETSPGEFAPVVMLKKITVLGEGAFPAAQKISFEELVGGQEDSQFVEINGIVRAVSFDESEKYYHLKIATGGGFLTALAMKLPVAKPEDLMGSKLQISGVCASRFNAQRQLYDLRLLVPRPEDLIVEIPAPANPFDQTARHIEQLMQFVPQSSRGNYVKISGLVIYCRNDTLYIQDANEGLLVETRQAGSLVPGDIVEVLGFPAKGVYTPKLEDAVFRKSGTGLVPTPETVTTAEALKGAYDGRLVRLVATVLDRSHYGHEQFLVLQSGGFIFNAYLEQKDAELNFSDLQNGSQVAVTGVCVIDPGDDWRVGPDWRAKSFRLLLRSPGDILLLQRPLWWNLGKLLWMVGLLLVGVLLALAWVFILRRRVNKQTAIIRRQLQNEATLKERYEDLFENANDMVFTHDLKGGITSINKTGEQWLEGSRDKIISRNILTFIVAEQREAAAQWLEQIVTNAELAPAEWDFLGANGKRLRLEISARLVGESGKNHEVESVARDITERKRLEREILQISNREQRRIGHDLHDGVCQQLAAIAYRVDILADQLSERKFPESVEAERIGSLLNEAMSQTRSVARGLFPVRLEEEGLVSALEEVAANATKLFKVHCHFSCGQPHPKLETTAALHLFYIAQEAVLNAAKHGGATEISVTITRHHERFTLVVQDNGQGFEASERPLGGMGIRIMRYRAQVIDATLDLKSRAGQGTQVICTFHAAT